MIWLLAGTLWCLHVLCVGHIEMTVMVGGMMILEPLRSKPLSDVSLFLLSQYLWVILGACLHVVDYPFWYEPIDNTMQLLLS